jgi:hypothetical protein
MKRTMKLWAILCIAMLSPTFFAQAEEPAAEFTPPQLGAPTARIGGGTRDISNVLTGALTTPDQATAQIELLANHQIGLTSVATPTLYWYAPTLLPYNIEITVQQTNNPPLLKKTIGVIKTAGMQKIQLSNYGIKLMEGQDYTWSVTVITNPAQRTANVLTSAAIRYQQPSTPLTDTKQMLKEGYWYDAVTQLVESHSPQLTELLQQEDININLNK